MNSNSSLNVFIYYNNISIAAALNSVTIISFYNFVFSLSFSIVIY